MSESHRAFLALQGRTFPQVGDLGRYVHNVLDLLQKDRTRMRPEAAVAVLAVTPSGLTLTVQFVPRWARRRFGAEPFRVYRRGDRPDGSGWYLPGHRHNLGGEVLFTSGQAVTPWRITSTKAWRKTAPKR
jgi:hypothetical protein